MSHFICVCCVGYIFDVGTILYKRPPARPQRWVPCNIRAQPRLLLEIGVLGQDEAVEPSERVRVNKVNNMRKEHYYLTDFREESFPNRLGG